jgi:acyl carrier protein
VSVPRADDIPTRDVLLRTVIELVAITVDDKRARIEPDTPLFSRVEQFDSFALMELVLRLERTFGLSIPDEDLDRDAFSSPLTIVTYLCGRLQPGRPRWHESLK